MSFWEWVSQYSPETVFSAISLVVSIGSAAYIWATRPSAAFALPKLVNPFMRPEFSGFAARNLLAEYNVTALYSIISVGDMLASDVSIKGVNCSAFFIESEENAVDLTKRLPIVTRDKATQFIAVCNTRELHGKPYKIKLRWLDSPIRINRYKTKTFTLDTN